MTSFVSLWIWLGLSLVAADDRPSPRQPQPIFRVFADLNHTGILSGPLASGSPTANEFGIVVPLPAAGGGRDRWPEKLDADDPIVKRLGRLRVEATPAAGDIVVSIESESRRSLRLFRNDAGGWRRQAANEDHGMDTDAGQRRSGGSRRSRDDSRADGRLSTKGLAAGIHRRNIDEVKARHAAARAVPRGAYVIPSALDPVDELLILSQAVTADSVRSVRVVRGKNGAEARHSRS